MRSFLLIGDDSARFHPLPPVEPLIRRAFSDVRWTVSYDYPSLTRADFTRYDLIVNYADMWGLRDTAQAGPALLAALRGGARMLALHGALIGHGDKTLEPLFGAVFTGHPPQCELRYVPDAAHPACAGICPFALYEEPYRFSPVDSTEKTPVLSYWLDGAEYPAGWSSRCGDGKMLYLSPGHCAESFENPSFVALMRRAAEWLIR